MSSLLKPLRFRFTHREDVEAFGEGWFTYDESVITELPSRKLQALEEETGVPLPEMMTGLRINSAMGDRTCTWAALKLALADGCPPYDAYDPRTLKIVWEAIPDAELSAGKEDGPDRLAGRLGDAVPMSAEEKALAELPSPDTSATDTVSLPSLPPTV